MADGRTCPAVAPVPAAGLVDVTPGLFCDTADNLGLTPKNFFKLRVEDKIKVRANHGAAHRLSNMRTGRRTLVRAYAVANLKEACESSAIYNQVKMAIWLDVLYDKSGNLLAAVE